MKLKRIFKYFIFHLTLCILFIIPIFAWAGVSNTKHNLSVTGTGVIKAVNETQICIFCHTPHNASPVYPLWNHELSTVANYINYWSDTLKSYTSEGAAPPIDGFSKLCLSCHDGTVAIGSLMTGREVFLAGEIPMITIPDISELGIMRPGAEGYIGTDLSGGHPISIIFDFSLASRRNAEEDLMPLRWPIIDKDVKLYPTQGGYGVQCPSCHDPHTNRSIEQDPSDPTKLWPPLWRKTTYDEVCLVCHIP